MVRLFKGQVLPSELVLDLRQLNPWWEGKPGPEDGRLPFKRWPFQIIKKRLRDGLAPIIVIRGPRQVGKTVLQFQIIETLLNEGVAPERILRVQFDPLSSLKAAKLQEPILRITEWYERSVLKQTLNETAKEGNLSYLFFDEVQNLVEWATQLKSLVDSSTVRVVATGSSALRIAAGRDSLAGRITMVEVGPLLLREIAELRSFGTIPEFSSGNAWGELFRKEMWEDLKEHGSRHQRLKNEAFAAFSDRGAYPLAQSKPEIPWPELAEQLNEVIVRRVISHDIQASPRGRPRDKGLLAELFVLAARYAGQAPRPAFLADEARRALSSNISSQRLTSYLGFLNDSLLFRMVKPLEVARKKKTGADKITLCDHALRASYLQEKVPLTPEGLATDPALATAAGYIADSAVGYFLSTMPAIGVSWFPERGAEPEVDYVLVVGDKRVPLEVKYQTRIDPYRDTAGVRSFIERVHYNAVFGLLITRTEGVNLDDPRLICIPLSTLLLLR